jgi:asparagine synthase (glutamine-hydrolysing)
MCGIWAFINLLKNGNTPNYEQLFADFMKMKARGPDSTDFQIIKNLSVGFHRLAIMEPSIHANQPYIIKDGERTIVFVCNGEIYDFKELIREYELDITTNSDCLTIPKLYLKYVKHNSSGKNDISRFTELFSHKIKGEYAFLLFEFDRLMNLKEVLVGRDHIGIRPLYEGFEYDVHAVTNSNYTSLIFGSEIKSMTSFQGQVKEFEPGTIKHFSLDSFGSIVYEKKHDFKTIYNVVPMDDKFIKNVEETEQMLLTKVRGSFINAVKRRMVADANIAYLLSGGLDSLCTASVAAALSNKPISTYCLGLVGTDSTDIKFARRAAEHIKSRHTEVMVTIEEALSMIETVVKVVESFCITTIRASIPQYLVCKYIGEKTDAKVIMTGEANDEIAAGYRLFYYAPSPNEMHKACLEYVQRIHMYDGRRCDRAISAVSCEARVPFADPDFISTYWSVPSKWRMPTAEHMEKEFFRKCFDGTDIVEKTVLWRRKEAFSDGISGTTKSWFQILQEHIETLVSNEEFAKNTWNAQTKEDYYYKKIFVKYYGEKRLNIIPGHWQPKWDANGNELKGYVDPSARTLANYNPETQEL